MLQLRAPRARPRLVTATALALVAASIASCGGGSSGGRLSHASASDLRATLDQIQQNVSAHNCTGAAQEAAALQQQIDSLNRVGSELRGALRASARRLSTLIADQCQTATTTVPTQTQTTPQDTQPAVPPGQQKKKEKAKKPGKGPKVPPTDTTPTTPGTGDQQPQTPPDTGGGAGIPGESNQGQ